jgi:predicted XRE-type DNA-binding protein
MSNQTFLSVWDDAIEDTPEQAENMKLRSVLMMAIKDHIVRTEMSQAQAAKRFGVTQPRVSDLMRGKINLFALDALVNMAAAANMRIEMRVLEAPVKRSAGTTSVKTAAGKKQTATAKQPTTADKSATKAPARRSKGGVTAAVHAR